MIQKGEEILINSIAKRVKDKLVNAESGHDWLHIERVWKNAILILESGIESNHLIVQLAALLHDIADSKFHQGNENIGPQTANAILNEFEVEEETKDEVVKIIENISYKGGFNENAYRSPELDIVRDADRLDAIGAIGIARAFAYGGFKNRRLYDPEHRPVTFQNKEEYKNNEGPTINHFYEKLFKLKDLMATEKGKELARERDEFMRTFVDQFYHEIQ